MRKLTVIFTMALLFAVAAPLTAQTVIDFESVAVCDNARPNMGVYAGIDFLSQWTCYDSPQPPFNPASGTNRIYAVDGTANAASGFFDFVGGAGTFYGAYMAGSAEVMFRMFLTGSLVATSSTLLTTGTPTYLSSGYGGAVDRVEVVGTDVNWVLDDLTVDVVPEPMSVILLSTGLLGIAGVAYRRRRDDEAC